MSGETTMKSVDDVYDELDSKGIVRLDHLISSSHLESMQTAFEARLTGLRWNNADGYEQTERFRHMVQDVLTLDQGFVDLALHPLVNGVLRRYIGEAYSLNEAKGWKSLATKRDFHGWHGDKWYDQKAASSIPREVKLALYLTHVKTGAFHYITGTHRKQPPQDIHESEITETLKSQIVEMIGPAGTVILFDTSGIHRQGTPILESRNAVFLNYHDPAVTVQEESLRSYRYHPLLLNAAFLGGLSEEDKCILGFGDKSQYQPAFVGRSSGEVLRRLFERSHRLNLFVGDFAQRVTGRLKWMLGG